MNWPGIVFGAALATAIGGAVAAAFLPRVATATLALAASAIGVALMCLALGADYLALVIAVVPGAAVPGALIAACALAPPADPDVRAARGRRVAVGAGVVALFVALTLVFAGTPWPDAAGRRELTVDWLGSRLLSDALPVLVVATALLGLAAVGAVALLRPRARRR